MFFENIVVCMYYYMYISEQIRINSSFLHKKAVLCNRTKRLFVLCLFC